jgi:hypothetical protein
VICGFPLLHGAAHLHALDGLGDAALYTPILSLSTGSAARHDGGGGELDRTGQASMDGWIDLLLSTTQPTSSRAEPTQPNPTQSSPAQASLTRSSERSWTAQQTTSRREAPETKGPPSSVGARSRTHDKPPRPHLCVAFGDTSSIDAKGVHGWTRKHRQREG